MIHAETKAGSKTLEIEISGVLQDIVDEITNTIAQFGVMLVEDSRLKNEEIDDFASEYVGALAEEAAEILKDRLKGRDRAREN